MASRPQLIADMRMVPQLNTSFSGNVRLPPVEEVQQRRIHLRTATGSRKGSLPLQEKPPTAPINGEMLAGVDSVGSGIFIEGSEEGRPYSRPFQAKMLFPSSTRSVLSTTITPGMPHFISAQNSKQQSARDNFNWLAQNATIENIHRYLQRKSTARSKYALLSPDNPYIPKMRDTTPKPCRTNRRLDSSKNKKSKIGRQFIRKFLQLNSQSQLDAHEMPSYSPEKGRATDRIEDYNSMRASFFSPEDGLLTTTKRKKMKVSKISSMKESLRDGSPTPIDTSRGSQQIRIRKLKPKLKKRQTEEKHKLALILGNHDLRKSPLRSTSRRGPREIESRQTMQSLSRVYDRRETSGSPKQREHGSVHSYHSEREH